MKPRHRPPKTLPFIYDPQLKLLALNILIERERGAEVPHSLVAWSEVTLDECARFEKQSTKTRKRAA